MYWIIHDVWVVAGSCKKNSKKATQYEDIHTQFFLGSLSKISEKVVCISCLETEMLPILDNIFLSSSVVAETVTVFKLVKTASPFGSKDLLIIPPCWKIKDQTFGTNSKYPFSLHKVDSL